MTDIITSSTVHNAESLISQLRNIRQKVYVCYIQNTQPPSELIREFTHLRHQIKKWNSLTIQTSETQIQTPSCPLRYVDHNIQINQESQQWSNSPTSSTSSSLSPPGSSSSLNSAPRSKAFQKHAKRLIQEQQDRRRRISS